MKGLVAARAITLALLALAVGTTASATTATAETSPLSWSSPSAFDA